MNFPRLLGLLLVAGCCAAPACAQSSSAPATPPADTTENPDDVLSRAFWEDTELDLDYHPIGYSISRKKRYSFDNYIPMRPAGFRADKFSMYFAPTYSFGDGWEAALGITGAQRIGPRGEAIFFGGGVQKQFVQERRGMPAISLGLYGMGGPNGHNSQTLYLAASKRVAGGAAHKYSVFLTAGGKLERFDSDDYGNGTGLRPFAGAQLSYGKRLFFTTEISPAQPWERSTMYAARLSYRVYKQAAISGGIRNNGYRTLPFIGLEF